MQDNKDLKVEYIADPTPKIKEIKSIGGATSASVTEILE
jgi:hypothetical protein